MVAVPVVDNFSVQENPAATPYKSANVNEATFNKTMGMDDVGRGMIYDSKAMEEIRNEQNKTAVMEKSTQFDNEVLKTLYDKDNGLYTKQGKAYLDSVEPTMQTLNKTKEALVGSLDNDQQKMAMAVFGQKMANINEDIYKNSAKQNQVYREQTLDDLINTQTQMALVNRNNAGAVKTNVANINASIAATFGNSVDAETLKNMQKKATSDVLTNVLEGRIADKNLYSKDFFNEFKSQIDPTKHAQLTEAINNVTADVTSRLNADSWFGAGLSEQDAYKKAHAIKDLNLRDATERQVSSIYGRQREMKNQAEDDYAKKTWEVLFKNPDINLIPSDMPAQKKIDMINFCQKNGKVETDLNTWGELSRLSTDNPAEFKKLDLTQFSGSVSQNDLHVLAKKQQLVGTPEYSVIMANDGYVKNAANTLGFTKNKKNKWDSRREELASDAQTIIHDMETSKGRALKPYEKANIINAMSYKSKGGGMTPKDTTTFDTIHKGIDLTSEEGYLKSVSDAIIDFEKKNSRQPNQKELYDITWHFANLSTAQQQQKVQSAIDSAYGVSHHLPSNYQQSIHGTQAKPHETKALTYYADNYLPNLGKQLGTKLTIVDGGRFRNQDGSHHKEGLAADISMSEHNFNDKSKIIASQIANPMVKAIGTSDPYLLKRFGHSPKVVDERTYDAQHGTTHENHLHITLNKESSGGVVIAHNQSTVRMKAPNGNIYNVPVAQVAEYQKIGGVKI